jgi:hypothetical protein
MKKPGLNRPSLELERFRPILELALNEKALITMRFAVQSPSWQSVEFCRLRFRGFWRLARA